MSAVNFTLKPEKTTKLYLDNSFALKKRFNYVYVDLVVLYHDGKIYNSIWKVYFFHK